MKKLFEIELICPFCGKKIVYSILSFRAKHECEHCENDLIVRTKPFFSAMISFVGFFVLFGVISLLEILQLGEIVRLVFIIIACLIYLAIAYRLLCLVIGPNKIYAVDAQDPTLLERKRKMK